MPPCAALDSISLFFPRDKSFRRPSLDLMSTLDPIQVAQEFPILKTWVHGKRLVYLDNAATTQKPSCVLDASRDYYEHLNSNIHRGVHHLAQLATSAHEKARESIAAHLNAERPEEVVFTSGCTDSLNLVASILTDSGKVRPGDEVILSGLEHHSNTVPWQMLCQKTGAHLKIIPVLDDGTLDLEAYQNLLSEKTRIVSVNQISNAFGTRNPVQEICRLARETGAISIIDAAQSVPHGPVDVQDIGCDFLAFSGHKTYGPTGIGILWGRHQLLCELPPWKGGGEMIAEVTFEKTSYNVPPFKYEAGTPNIEGAIALSRALAYMDSLGLNALAEHETDLTRYCAEQLSSLDGITLYGPADRTGAVSFTFAGVHHYDLGTLLDQMGIAVRTGHHCCQPLMKRFGITGTLRASFAAYNSRDDVDQLLTALSRALPMLR